MRDPRDDIRKVIEWHVRCITEGPGQFPCNFVPLVVGPSGSGKTYTITESLNEWDIVLDDRELSVPFVYIDATQLTSEGWEGQSLSNVLRDAYTFYGEDLKYAVIYIDEVDKLAATGADSNHSAHNLAIQSNLLSWLDKGVPKSIAGNSRSRAIEISTAQMTWIFSGAFESLFVAKSLDNKGMGFNAEVEKNRKVNYNQKLGWEDIKKAGLMPELVNRMNVLIQTYEYSDKEMTEIIKENYDKRFIETILGVKIPMARALRDAKKFKAGARGISKALYQEALEKYQFKE